MRSDEKFVMSALAVEFSTTWRKGENPPDAYLALGYGEAAIEISTMVQLVSGGGPLRSRLTDDMATNRMVQELNVELGDLIPLGSTIGLVLNSPLKEVRKTKALLARILTERAAALETLASDEKIVVNGNHVTLFHNRHGDTVYPKITAVFGNRNSSPDVLHNAQVALEDRIRQKAEKCRDVKSRPLWLALRNGLWLTEPYVFQMALSSMKLAHPFDRILVIGDGGDVVSLS